MRKDYRIQVTIGYEPDLRNYPPSVTSKREALQLELNSIFDGFSEVGELIESADAVVYQVVEVEVSE